MLTVPCEINVSKVSCVCYAGCAYYIYVRPLARGIVAKSFYPQIVNGKAKGGLHVGGKGSWTYAKCHYSTRRRCEVKFLGENNFELKGLRDCALRSTALTHSNID